MSLSWSDFRSAVDAARAALPAALAAVLAEVDVILADEPFADLIAEGEDPDLLGVFMGPPRGEEPAPGELTARIYLFRGPHERWEVARDELVDEIRTTLWHELGHYLGYDEEGLEALGLD